MPSSWFVTMARVGIVVLLGLISCAYTAPGSSRLMLHDLMVKYLSESHPEILKLNEVATVLKTIRDGREVKDNDDVKSSTGNKKGVLDRGFVSDLIDSTLSGVHLGLSIGSSNGTANKLCIKLGNITMAGCRRTAAQKEKSNVNKPIEIQLDQNATDLPNSRESESNTRIGRSKRGDVYEALAKFLDLIYKMFGETDN